MGLRDWLAGVAAAALLGVSPAAAQAPRSLFEALPAPAGASPVTTGFQLPAAKPDKAQGKAGPIAAPSVADEAGKAGKAVTDKPKKTASAVDAPVTAAKLRTSAPVLSEAAQDQSAGDEASKADRRPIPRRQAKAEPPTLAGSAAALPSSAAPPGAAPTPLVSAPPAPEAGRKPLSRAERLKARREAREAKRQQPAAEAAAQEAASPQPAPTFASNPFMTLFGAVPAQGRGEALPPVSGRPEIDRLVAYHAKLNHVPESLVHRIIVRESRYNPRAVGRGGAMGLMQIKTATARGVGYTGGPAGLLDAETNLTYGIKYLAGAWRVAGGSHDRAVSHYARGYYYEAKRRGLAGPRRRGEPEPVTTAAAAPQAPTFFSLFTRQAAAQ